MKNKFVVKMKRVFRLKVVKRLIKKFFCKSKIKGMVVGGMKIVVVVMIGLLSYK